MLKPSRYIQASFCISEECLNFLRLGRLEQNFSQNCLNNHDNNNIFLNLPPTSRLLHPLQAENCENCNSRLVVDEDNNEKFRLEKVKQHVIMPFIPWNLKILHENSFRTTTCTHPRLFLDKINMAQICENHVVHFDVNLAIQLFFVILSR